MQSCPWSNRQLERLGDHIRARSEPEDELPSYAEVVSWYNSLALQVQHRLENHDWSSLLGDRVPEITSRPKTMGTLRAKLLRQPKTPLARIGDIAGVRFEAEMTLSEQDAVVLAIAGAFSQSLPSTVRDLRRNPHSGYRAVHLRLKLQRLVEVQVRTHLQGEWANAYEAAADLIGRDIRYGTVPADPEERRIMERLQQCSVDLIDGIENVSDRLHEQERVPVAAADSEHARMLRELRVDIASAEIDLREALATLRQQFREAKRGA
jgi:ppGpp synthetase/RelA/SpoT-type nucleotidyltranferase